MPTHAANGADWNAGYIIDDAIFYDNSSMDTAQIQAFLNSMVPVCDTSGTKPSELGGGSRAQYGASRGYPAPFVCVRDYMENPTTKENNLSTGSQNVPGGISAAQIIKNAADTYSISPKVLLVLIQKESSMITDDWPLRVQYNAIMGYGCPDTGPNNSANCDASYYGFYNQVMNAARQFRLYANRPQDYRYKANQTNSIQYSPTYSCGAGVVYIQNSATAALYNYTPYQPNAAALNNLYGTGDSCSAYGNRNFWRMFSDWFGRPTFDCKTGESASSGITRLYNPTTYKHFYTGYDCEARTLAQKQGYRIEGALLYQTNGASPYAVVVHRLYNPTTYQHLWATTQEDINNATQNAGFRYEGVAFYAVKPEVPNHMVVHRLYNPKTYQHLWATTQEDINNATQNAGFRYEGVAYFGAPPPRQ